MLGWEFLQLFERSGNDTADNSQAEWAAMVDCVLGGVPVGSKIGIDQVKGCDAGINEWDVVILDRILAVNEILAVAQALGNVEN